MDFTVRFHATGDYVCRAKETRVGMEDVDLIRTELGLPGFDIKRIDSCIVSICYNPEITITEKMARRSGLFAKSNKFLVETNPNIFDDFVYKSVGKRIDQKTGEVERAWVRFEVQETNAIKAWENAGFPVEWGVEE